MATGAAVATIAGTGLSIFGQMEQSKAEGRALAQQADAKRLQAQELLNRTEINIGALKDEARQMKARQATAFAAAGVDVGSGSALVQAEALNEQLVKQINNEREAALFTAESILRGADIDMETAANLKKANFFNVLGTGLSGVGSAAGALRGPVRQQGAVAGAKAAKGK